MEFKGTKGEWKTDLQADYFTKGITTIEVYVDEYPLSENKWICQVNSVLSETIEEDKANAQLIADAGTTANMCGLLPSQLLKQRNELLEALQEVKQLEVLIKYPENVSPEHEGEAQAINSLLNKIDNAIKKAIG